LVPWFPENIYFFVSLYCAGAGPNLSGARLIRALSISHPAQPEVTAGNRCFAPRRAFCCRRGRKTPKPEEHMPKETHTKAAEHHENAAKSHRAAAEHHGKNDHAAAHDHSTRAHEHSSQAHQHSADAHKKSEGQRSAKK
jgi:hypothetical protein